MPPSGLFDSSLCREEEGVTILQLLDRTTRKRERTPTLFNAAGQVDESDDLFFSDRKCPAYIAEHDKMWSFQPC